MDVQPRKVFVSGSSYIVTLPKKWLEENNIKAGDIVYIEVGKNSIRIFPSLSKVSEKEGVISGVKKADTLIRKVISYYLAGYTSIRVKVPPEIRKAVYEAVEMLIGAEVIEDYVNELKIVIFHSERRFKPEELLDKMFSVTQSMHEDLSKCMEEFDENLCVSIVDREKEVDRLYFLILRQLKMALSYQDVASMINLKPREILGYRIVVKNVERVADHLTTMAEEMLRQRRGCEFYQISEEVRRSFRIAMNSFFKRDENLAEELFELTRDLKAKLRVFEVSDAKEALLKKTISDALSRIVGYSEDVAEIVLNLSVE